MGFTNAPVISVVIPSASGLPHIVDCVEALVSQEARVGAQILVMDCSGEETRAAIARRFPQVQVVTVEGRRSIPALRALGIKRARGRMVAFLADRYRPDRGWLEAIENAHRSGRPAVGGAVEKSGSGSLVDWAAFFCEYAPFMLPLERGSVSRLPGNNSAYDRRLLGRLGSEFEEELWEGQLHARLRELGVALHAEPGLLVWLDVHSSFARTLSQRYHHSRSLAGLRVQNWSLWRRLLYVGAAPLVPALLLARLIVTMTRKRRRWGRFALALPVVMVLLMGGAWGEALGALLGPGDSPNRVE